MTAGDWVFVALSTFGFGFAIYCFVDLWREWSAHRRFQRLIAEASARRSNLTPPADQPGDPL